VLYVPNLQTRLFSIESFVANGRYSVTYTAMAARLSFRDNISMTISLPHVPPSTYIANEVFDIGADNLHQGFEARISRARSNAQFLELQPLIPKGKNLKTSTKSYIHKNTFNT
jgi:hypothetical protein